MNSFTWNGACAIGFALACAVGSPALAQLGGSPTDPLSCYSDCGARSGTGTPSCACDDGCNSRGNCCADRNLYCSASVVAPACSLTSNQHSSKFCGTDLGFVVQHSGKLEVLFGDSWEWLEDIPSDRTSCTTRGLYSVSDDSQGTLPVTRPASSLVPLRAASIPASGISNCNSSILTLDTSGTPSNYTAITLFMPNGEELPLYPGSTPTAAFSDGTNMWAMFKANGPPERAEPGHSYIAFREGTRTKYRVRVDLGNNGSNFFINPSATRITSYNATDPKLSNFALPSGADAGVLLIFTRPKFWSTSSQDADTNGMYLVRQDARISTSGTPTWSPQYFKGIDATTDKPLWTGNVSEAVPMLTVPGTTAGDFKAVNEIDIKWVPELRKWIMLYGGDLHFSTPPPPNDQPRHGAIHLRMAEFPWGPWSPPTPLLWREQMRGYFDCDAPKPAVGSCVWGDPGWCGCDPSTYDVGTWKHGQSGAIQGCTKTLTQPIQPNTVSDPLGSSCWYAPPSSIIPNWNQRGLLYAAELIPSWTNAGPANFSTLLRPVTLYFLVSTWMPYQVVLAAADLNVPNNTYSQAPLLAQLRDYQGKLLTVGTITVGNQINNTTSWWVQNTAATQPNEPIRIGDEVYFRSMSNGGLTFLSRSGDNVQFLVNPPAPFPDRVKWKIDTIDPVRYPVGMAIEYGKTPFLVRDLGTRRLKSKIDGVRNLVGGGGDSYWTMTWHCQNGDSCP